IDRGVLEAAGQARAAPLAKHHQLAGAGADGVHRHDGVGPGPETTGVLLVDQLRAQQQQLAPIHAGFLLGRYDRAFHAREKHVGGSWVFRPGAVYSYFFLGRTNSTSLCGRAMTCTLTKSPLMALTA